MISGRRPWPSSLRHFFCADIISLKAMASPVLRPRHPLVRFVRCRTVAKVLSIRFDVRMCFQCSAGIVIEGQQRIPVAELVASCRDTAPKLADWLEKNVPEGLAVFTRPEHHRKRLRTSTPIERSVQQELKRRTVKVRVFPGEDALLRLFSAVRVEIDDKWAADTKAA